jgi:hypothetical protein
MKNINEGLSWRAEKNSGMETEWNENAWTSSHRAFRTSPQRRSAAMIILFIVSYV